MEPNLKTVLVVEDDANDRLLMQELLSAEGVTAILAKDGEAALAALAERLPDLAIVDLMLPKGMDGFELTRRLKTDPRTRTIPILIVTALQDRESRLQALELGAEEFICKPVDRAELTVRVRNLLKLKEYQDFLADHSRILEEQVAERTLALSRQKDLYNALSQTNEAIVRASGRDELFAAVCRIAVENGHFRFALVVLLDENERQARPVAKYGNDAGTLDQLSMSLNDADATSRGITGQVVRSGRHGISNDVLNDPVTAPWHEAARHAGVGSVGSFPICLGGAVTGAFNVYAGEPGFFTDDLIAVLDEMAIDISFALDNIEREAALLRAMEELRAAAEQFRGLVEQTIAGIYIIQDERFAYLNPRFAEIFGYASADELIGRDSLSVVAEKDRGMVAENIRLRIAGEVRALNFSFTGQRKDGSLIEVGLNSAYATYRGRAAIIGLLQDISEKKRAEERIQGYIEQLESAFMRTVEVATTLSEMRDPYTAGHERRVGELATAIGAELGFDAPRQEGLKVAGYLHDIGKINIPSEILSKPGKLSPIEYQLIQGHPRAGYDVLKEVMFPWPVAEVALQHHERIDGSGYPQGLKGEAILLEARIMAVADVIEAMSSHRPYRPGLGIDRALAEIARGRGTAYDPVVAEACLKLFREKGYAIPV